MMNWTGSGKPNARFWVLKLLKDNFGPGDKLPETKSQNGSAIEVQAFGTSAGNKLLLINKRNRPVHVKLPSDFANGAATFVDESTGDEQHVITQSIGGSPCGPDVTIEHVHLWNGDRVLLSVRIWTPFPVDGRVLESK